MERRKILMNKYNLIYNLFNNNEEIKLTNKNMNINMNKIVLTYNDLIDDEIKLTKLSGHYKK